MNKLALMMCVLFAVNISVVFAANDQTLYAPATAMRIEIVNSCTLNSVSSGTATLGTLDFGKVYRLNSLSDATTAVGGGTLQLRCTPGTTAKITLGAGLYGSSVNNRKMRIQSGVATLSYQLYTTSARQTVWNDTTGVSVVFANDAVQTIPVYGRIPAQTTPASGTYSDQVTVTVSY